MKIGILQRLFGRKTEKRADYPPHWLTRLFDDWQKSASGVNVTAESALRFGAFYSAIDLISRALAWLPLVVYERKGPDARERAYDHPNHELLHTRPNPEQTAYVWRQGMQSAVLRWGNAYSEIVRYGDGRPIALWPIDPTKITVERTKSGVLVYIYGKHSGSEKQIPSEDIIHIRTLGNGLVGKSPVSLFRESIGLGLAAEKTGAAFFGNMMRPSMILSHPGVLGEEALKNLRESMREMHGGGENAAKLMIFEENMKAEQWTIPPGDAQFLETRTFQVRDIARIFHIPPHKLADLADATFSNVEEQNIEWLTDCIGPWIVNWEQELDWKLFKPSERGRYFTKFSLQGILRGNSQQRSDFYTKMFMIGVFSINNILRLEDMNPIKNGDTHYVPLNMVDVNAPPQPKPLDKAHRRLLRDACGRVSRIEAGERRDGKPLSGEVRSRIIDILSGPAHSCVPDADLDAIRERISALIDLRENPEAESLMTQLESELWRPSHAGSE